MEPQPGGRDDCHGRSQAAVTIATVAVLKALGAGIQHEDLGG